MPWPNHLIRIDSKIYTDHLFVFLGTFCSIYVIVERGIGSLVNDISSLSL
jgi:hypothetical protein